MAMRLIKTASLVLLLSFVFGQVMAQDSDTYAEEYDAFTKIQAETSAAKQKTMALAFVKQFKKSQLDPNVSYYYAQALQAYRTSGQWSNLAKEASSFLNYRPTDKNMVGMATEAYQKLNQPSKMVELGSKLYRQSPSAGTAYLVAKAYQSLGDTANFSKWAATTLRHDPNNTEMLVEGVRSAWARNDFALASKNANKALKGLAKAKDPESVKQAQAFCYRAIGEESWVVQSLAKAKQNFEKAAELDPKNDFAHLRLGDIYWRDKKIDDSINAFAKAVAIGGSSAREARKQLYTLLRQRYGSTGNANTIINAAKTELGI
jgi:tetratricopeptide (TPR) repeat protein